MKNLIILMLTLTFVTLIASVTFASNGSKGDWGFDPKYYKYALIEGEVISVDHDKGTLMVKGNDKALHFDDKTEFGKGDISLPMENVFNDVKFTEDERILSGHVSVGDVIKSRYSKLDNGKILLDTCLVGVESNSFDKVGKNDDTLVAEE